MRTLLDPMRLANSVAAVVHAMEPEAPVDIRTLDAVVGRTIARQRAISVLVGVCALVGPRSGCDWRLRRDGLLGEGANAGNRRPHCARRVGRLDLSHGHRSSVAAGGARYRDGCSPPRGSRLLEPLLFDVQPFDPSTFALTALALLVITAVDAYIPARRGMRMAPIDALRVN